MLLMSWLKQRKRNDLEIDFDMFDNVFIEEDLAGSNTMLYLLGLLATVGLGVFLVMRGGKVVEAKVAEEVTNDTKKGKRKN